MKKIAFFGFMASMLFGSAFAAVTESATLTTKSYVDDGLRYVYGVKADKDSVYTKNEVYTKDDVYTKQESDAKYLTSVDIAGMDGTAYTADKGIAINNHKVELDVDANEGSMYVYTSGGWVELPVRNQWNPDMLIPSEDD